MDWRPYVVSMVLHPQCPRLLAQVSWVWLATVAEDQLEGSEQRLSDCLARFSISELERGGTIEKHR
jgi:hypothetical protein